MRRQPLAADDGTKSLRSNTQRKGSKIMAHEHVDPLKELQKEFQIKLDRINPEDTAAIDKVTAEFCERALAVGLEYTPKVVRITSTKGDKPHLGWE
jgi:hypothetical protein